MYRSIGTLAAFLADSGIPEGMFETADFGSFFDRIFVLDHTCMSDDEKETASSKLRLGFENEISIGFPGVDSAAFVIGKPGGNFVTATLERGHGTFAIILESFRFAIRFHPDEVGADVGGEGSPSELAYEGTIRIASDLSITATDGRVTGDLDGIVSPDEVIDIIGFRLSKSCLTVRWREPAVNHWLSELPRDKGREPGTQLVPPCRAVHATHSLTSTGWKHHYFALATQHANTALQRVLGASFHVVYKQLSEDGSSQTELTFHGARLCMRAWLRAWLLYGEVCKLGHGRSIRAAIDAQAIDVPFTAGALPAQDAQDRAIDELSTEPARK